MNFKKFPEKLISAYREGKISRTTFIQKFNQAQGNLYSTVMVSYGGETKIIYRGGIGLMTENGIEVGSACFKSIQEYKRYVDLFMCKWTRAAKNEILSGVTK